MITNEMYNAQAVAAARDYVERKRYRRPPDVIAQPNDYFSEEALLQLADRLEAAEQRIAEMPDELDCRMEDAALGRAVRAMPIRSLLIHNELDAWVYYPGHYYVVGNDPERRREGDTPLDALQAAKETQNV